MAKLYNQFFLEYYHLEVYQDEHEVVYSIYEKTILASYYAFTSLSTVGFGDFAPKSDPERLLCSFILLFGVAIFSYIMGNFIEILDQFEAINEDLDDDENLSQFFGMLEKFNGNKPICRKLQNKIMHFLTYKWKYDKNQAIDEEEEL